VTEPPITWSFENDDTSDDWGWPIGIKAGLREQRASSAAVGDTFLGKILGPLQGDTRQAVISAEAYSKIEKDESTQGK
jgi:hypothetical protein